MAVQNKTTFHPGPVLPPSGEDSPFRNLPLDLADNVAKFDAAITRITVVAMGF